MKPFLKQKCKIAAIALLLPVMLSAPVSALLFGLAAYVAGKLSKDGTSPDVGNRIQLMALSVMCLPMLVFHHAWTIGVCALTVAGMHILLRSYEDVHDTTEREHSCVNAGCRERLAPEVTAEHVDVNGTMHCSDKKVRSAGFGDGVVIDAEFVVKD